MFIYFSVIFINQILNLRLSPYQNYINFLILCSQGTVFIVLTLPNYKIKGKIKMDYFINFSLDSIGKLNLKAYFKKKRQRTD